MMLNAADVKQLEMVSTLKGVVSILGAWLAIVCAVAAALLFPWIYPFAVLVIANRIMALGLLAHEGIHGLLSPSARLNDILARYFCAIPTFISLSKWRLRHLVHHRFVGTSADYDAYLYTYFPLSFSTFLKQFLSGQIFLGHLLYFTDLDQVIKIRGVPTAPVLKSKDTDTLSFLIFLGGVMLLLFLAGWWVEFFMLWIVPYLLCQPMTLLYNCLEHSGVYLDADENRRSRTITGPSWLIGLFLPLNVNFHGEHHLFPKVPQYNLPHMHRLVLAENSNVLFYQSFVDTMKAVILK
ncbi:MAG: fatty acid desaturase family protein [Bdellovibrionaceae bacterium]|nr:fatty acid desaturase family protein [Pseudobdellovibrionaceae bacterium]